jgi:hypothetical protein
MEIMLLVNYKDLLEILRLHQKTLTKVVFNKQATLFYKPLVV